MQVKISSYRTGLQAKSGGEIVMMQLKGLSKKRKQKKERKSSNTRSVSNLFRN